MEVTVDYLGSVQFEVKARNHRIVSDQPGENGGFDEGMTPPEFLLASLGSCAAYYAVDYLKRMNLDASGVHVRVTAEKLKPKLVPGTRPAGVRLDNFHVDVDVAAQLSPAQEAGLDDAVHRCLVHNTLTTPPSIAIAIRTLAGAERN